VSVVRLKEQHEQATDCPWIASRSAPLHICPGGVGNIRLGSFQILDQQSLTREHRADAAALKSHCWLRRTDEHRFGFLHRIDRVFKTLHLKTEMIRRPGKREIGELSFSARSFKSVACITLNRPLPT